MLRRLFILFFFVIICAIEASAQSKIDSLLTHLKKGNEDTNKVIHLNKLCQKYQSIGSYDSASHYGNAALQLARQLNFKNGIIFALKFVSLFYECNCSK